MKWEIVSVGINAKPVHFGEARVEPEGEALSIPIYNATFTYSHELLVSDRIRIE